MLHVHCKNQFKICYSPILCFDRFEIEFEKFGFCELLRHILQHWNYSELSHTQIFHIYRGGATPSVQSRCFMLYFTSIWNCRFGKPKIAIFAAAQWIINLCYANVFFNPKMSNMYPIWKCMHIHLNIWKTIFLIDGAFIFICLKHFKNS